MQTLPRNALLGALAAGCTHGSPAEQTLLQTDDSDFVVPDPATSSEPVSIEPVAVGFTFDGILLHDGRVAGYKVEGFGTIDPTLNLILVTDAFFGATGEPREAEYCVVAAHAAPAPAPAPIPTHDGATLHTSYEVALDVLGTTCGPDLQDLVDAFDGAHVGYGWGPLTDPLRDVWSQDTLDGFEHAMVATYVAIREAGGAWVARDRTTAVLYEWDPGSEAPVIGPDDLLLPIDVTGTAPGDPLPEGYLQAYANLFVDLDELDLSNLRR